MGKLMQPTNINDYFNPQRDKKNSQSIWWWIGGATLSLGLSVSIPMNPGVNIQSITRLLSAGAVAACGGRILWIVSSRDASSTYRFGYQTAQDMVFQNALTQHTNAQMEADNAFYGQMLPSETPAPPIQQQLPSRKGAESSEEDYLLPPIENPEEYDLDYSYESENQFFDWKLFDKQSDKYAHIAIVGGTGDGKSFTAENVSAVLGGLLLISHPHRKPSDYPGVKAIHCGGRNYGEWKTDKPVTFKELIEPPPNSRISFASLVKTLELEMDRRYKLYENGNDNYPMVNIILDEMNTCLAKIPEAIKGKDAPIKNLIREARKVKLRLVMLLQDDSVEALQIQGEGSIRKCFRYVRLGEFAKVHAKKLKDDYLMQWVAQQKHPILVEETPAIIVPQKAVFNGDESAKKSDVRVDSAPPPPHIPAHDPHIPAQIAHTRTSLQHTGFTESAHPHIRTLEEAILGVQVWLDTPHTNRTPLFLEKSREEILLLFKALIHHKVGKIKTIEYGWGVARSGSSQKYKDAEAMYLSLLAEASGESEHIEFLKSLPTIEFPETRLLPATSGVYFVFDSEYNQYYIGSSENILLRWNSTRYPHHRVSQVKALVAQGRAIKIGWILTSNYLNLEAELVAKYKPLWNGEQCWLDK